MLLTKPQQSRFWREWSQYKTTRKKTGDTDAQIENERYQLLAQAGFESLTQVDPATGFDKLLAGLAALNQPADLNAQLRQANMPRRRLLYAINKLARNLTTRYLETILRDRFGHTDLDRLSLDQLTQFRNTLAARSGRKKRQLKADANCPF